jgi:DNA methylase
MASGELSEDEFTRFLNETLELAGFHAAGGAIIYACMDWRHMGEMLAAGRATGFDLLNVCIWVKSNGGMGSLYRSRHELVFVFRNGKEAHLNNVQLGRFGRNRTNVWNYAGTNSFPRKGQASALDLHPTVKPIAMVSDAILDSTKRNDIVLDPFAAAARPFLPPSAPAGTVAASRSIRSMWILQSRVGRERPESRRGTPPGRHSQTSKPNEDSHHESPAEGLQGRLQTTATTYPMEKGAMRQSNAPI